MFWYQPQNRAVYVNVIISIFRRFNNPAENFCHFQYRNVFTFTWKLQKTKLKTRKSWSLDYDAPLRLIVVVGTEGKVKGKVRYGQVWYGRVR